LENIVLLEEQFGPFYVLVISIFIILILLLGQ
jgi:hypothetical protein